MLLGDLVFTLCLLITVAFAALFASGRSRDFIDHTDDAPLGELLTITFACAASAIGLFHAIFQMRHYAHPQKQRLVARIILLPVIYAIDSLWAFEDTVDASIVAVIRDTYESTVLMAFMQLLCIYAEEHDIYSYMVDDPKRDAKTEANNKKTKKPLCTPEQVASWRFQVLQYAVLSPLMTLVVLIAHQFGAFNESSWSLGDAHVYATVIKAVSCTISLNALVSFYSVAKSHPDIHHSNENPTPQFLSIKGAIFLCCWQGLVLSMLSPYLPIEKMAAFLLRQSSIHTKSEEELKEATLGACESAMIVFEMLLAAIAHQFVFNYKLYSAKKGGNKVGHHYEEQEKVATKTTNHVGTHVDESGEVYLVKTSIITSVYHVLSFSDLVDDTKSAVKRAASPKKAAAAPAGCEEPKMNTSKKGTKAE